MKKLFFKYVLQNVAGMIGVSVYILADTFFISLYSGADGLTMLNLVIPIYGLMYAFGSMVGIGSAIRYALKKASGDENTDFYFTHALSWDLILSIPFILLGIFAPQWVLHLMGADARIKASGDENTDFYFTHALSWDLILSIPFILLGIFAPQWVLHLMGADARITELGIQYLRIILIGSPFFMMNYAFTAFARNDNATTIAMIGSLSGSAFNIVFDYIFMFPLNMGMAGAALATALSPIVTMSVCSIHYLGKKNTIGFRWRLPSPSHLLSCCKLGVSAFIGEIASAVTTTVFNILILAMAGNIGVAAYGVIANISIVALSIFNGISQGTQPLISETYGSGKTQQTKKLLKAVAAYGVIANISIVALSIFNGISQGTQPLISETYGSGKTQQTKKLLKAGLLLTLVAEIFVVAAVWILSEPLIQLFNSEGNALLVSYAQPGMKLYFSGFFIAGINLMLISYFAATDRAVLSFLSSILRGVIAIVLCAVVLSRIWGMTGIWLAFLTSELITLGITILVQGIAKKRAAY